MLYLTLAVAYEGFWGPLRQVYGPPGSVLGFAEDEPATLPHSLELAVYAKAPRLEVYIRPPQAQRLAHSQTAREGLAVYIAASDALGVSVDGLQAGDRNVITSATGLAIGTNFRGPVALPPCRTVYALTPHPFTYAPFGVLTGRRPT